MDWMIVAEKKVKRNLLLWLSDKASIRFLTSRKMRTWTPENMKMPAANSNKLSWRASGPDEKKVYNRAIIVSSTKVITVIIIKINMFDRELKFKTRRANIMNKLQSNLDLDKDCVFYFCSTYAHTLRIHRTKGNRFLRHVCF